MMVRYGGCRVFSRPQKPLKRDKVLRVRLFRFTFDREQKRKNSKKKWCAIPASFPPFGHVTPPSRCALLDRFFRAPLSAGCVCTRCVCV